MVALYLAKFHSDVTRVKTSGQLSVSGALFSDFRHIAGLFIRPFALKSSVGHS
jgi:hypothetical protein